MYTGALVGAVLWLTTFRTAMPRLGAFLSIVISGWAGVALYGLVRAEITLAGRGGRSPKTFVGNSARSIGLLILVFLVAFTYMMLHSS